MSRGADVTVPDRPLFLWGTDARAGLLVGEFAAFARKRTNKPDLLHIFEPKNTGDFDRELREFTASLRQSGREQGNFAEPAFVLMCAAFSPEAEKFPHVLQKVSQIAQELIPGDQSITLVALLPPPTSDEDEKQGENTCRAFLMLEKCIDSIPFVNTAFVNQLPGNLGVSGTRSVDRDEILFELLFRQLIDADLKDLIGRYGRQPIHHRYRMSERNCFCSTSGACRLVYPVEECIEYLEARFQHDLYYQGLKPDRSALGEEDRTAIQEVIDRFIKEITWELDNRLPQTGNCSLFQLKYPADGNTLQSQLSEITDFLQKTHLSAERKVEQETSFIKERMVRHFLDFMTKSPRYFRGVAWYANRLKGEKPFLRSEQKNDQGPSGVYLKHLKLESIQSLNLRESAEKLITGFDDKLKTLDFHIKSNDDDMKKVTKDSAEIEKKYRFFQKFLTKRGKFRREKDMIEKQQAQLQEQRNTNTKTLEDMQETLNQFILLLNNKIFPHVVRVKANRIFSKEVEKTTGAFFRFLSEAEDQIETRWAGAEDKISLILEGSKPMAETVLSQAKLETLYQQIIRRRPFRDLVDLFLRFFPAENSETLSYNGCLHLKDHYLRGVGSLLDRMTHFSIEEVRPLRNKNVLDIIEMEGNETPYQYLENRLGRIKKALDFSSGRVPVVKQRGFMNELLAVKTAASIQNRLTSNYGTLFGRETHFIDKEDPFSIDVTCLIFGFPFFAIHSLSDCEKYFQRPEEETSGQEPKP